MSFRKDPDKEAESEEAIEGEFEVIAEDDGEGVPPEATQEEVDEYERAHPGAFLTNDPDQIDGEQGTLGALRIVLPENATKADAIHVLSSRIPTNEYQLPTFWYRSDLLPYRLDLLSQDEADACVTALDYSEGYPTYGQGKIFWAQLPHEPFQDFLLFQRYLEQAENIGIRQLHLLSMDEQVNLGHISSLAKEFYWSYRGRAYDLFQVAAERKRRELRIRRTENTHFVKAEGLMTQLTHSLETDQEGDPFKGMLTKDKIECLRRLVEIQRVSMGLSLNGSTFGGANAPKHDEMAAASGADIMRDITRNTQQNDTLGIDQNLKALMADPNFILEAQKVVLQVRRGTSTDQVRIQKAIDD